MDIKLKNPTPAEVLEAAKNAIMNDKEYVFRVLDEHDNVLMSCDGFEDESDFANDTLTREWARCCVENGVWDEFDSLYPDYVNSDDEDYEWDD